MRIIFILLCSLILISCVNKPLSNSKHTKLDKAKVIFHESHWERRKNSPYSDAVQVGNLYFLTGQIGIDDKTRKLAPGGIEAETRQTLENIKEVLEQHDMTMRNVVKCMVILADINDFSKFNGVYKQYLPQKPARTTYAAGLVIGAKVEIECIAAK